MTHHLILCREMEGGVVIPQAKECTSEDDVRSSLKVCTVSGLFVPLHQQHQASLGLMG